MKKIFFLLLMGLFSCQQESKPKQVEKAFYYWKSNFKLSDSERKTLQENHIKKLYLKFFDVDWDFAKKEFQVKAPILFSDPISDSMVVVPTVFITNRTLENLPENQVHSLAEMISNKLNANAYKSSTYQKKLQLDCDWTLSTKNKYFLLLSILKKDNFSLSATIRLHQIKYFEKTGIPPVERGMLMFYNMADWRKPETKNAVFDLDVAGKYIASLEKYPLPLDVALPIFSQIVIYRNNHFFAFINYVTSNDLSKLDFLKNEQDNRFTVQHDTSFWNLALRKNDLIRADESEYEEILKGSRILRNKIQNEKLTFALYHLDEHNITTYNHEKIQFIFDSFR